MWLIYALAGAFSKSFGSVYRKPLGKSIDVVEGVWLSHSFGVLVFVIILFVTKQYSDLLAIIPDYFLIALLAGIIGVVAQYAFLIAAKLDDISRVVALFSFIPVINMIGSIIFLDEIPSLFGLLGVLLVVAGTYTVYLETTQNRRWFDPFASLVKSKSFPSVALVVLCWGAIPIIDKSSVANINLVVWGAYVLSLMWMIMSSMVLAKMIMTRRLPKIAKGMLGSAVKVGLGEGIGYVFGLLALSQVYVAYAQSLRRFDILFSAGLSRVILKEKISMNHVYGVVIMIIGTVTIALA
ncbi:EamA family transporter [Candidatus Saccharibacteria bacterium]|jgi:drug/metabolite transporter (DMT)-like permease|nr:EamA family transporter [Candidatus Saccharibacteria bacterium]